MHVRPRMNEPARLHKRNKPTVRLQTDNIAEVLPGNMTLGDVQRID